MMKPGISLSTKILLLALINLLLLAAVFLTFAHLQFRFDLSSVLLASARDRIVSTSRLAELDLTETPRAEWGNVLKEFSSRYPAQFYLFDEDGSELAGDAVQLPAEFVQRFRRHPMDHHGPMGPPPGMAGQAPGGAHSMPPPPPGRERHFSRGPDANPPLDVLHTTQPSQYWVGLPIPIFAPGIGQPVHAMLVWRFESLLTQHFYVDVRPWLTVAAVALLIPALCWIPFVRRMTGTIGRMTEATTRIADGHFDIKLVTRRRDELGMLSDSINRMAGRLAGYVTGQKRFLGDIAHELSSPIARMQIALAIVEQRIASSSAEYVADVQEELEQMSSLVDELLQFSRTSVAQRSAELQPVEIEPILRRAVNREGRTEGGIGLQVSQHLVAIADPDCLFRAVSNILRNAVRYAGNHGPIEVSASTDSHAGLVRIRIADAGPGIPEAELENIFRPFYRPEFARTRETGGTGLGLAIVRDCVETCGGRVTCRNLVPRGLEMVIELTGA